MSIMDIAPKTRNIYGRETHLELMRQFITGNLAASLLMLVGHGGTGKTKLLEEISATLSRQGRIFLPIYDFYHTDNFKTVSIERAIISAFADYRAVDAFDPYFAASEDLEHHRQTGNKFGEQQQQLRDTFVACYNVFARAHGSPKQPLVLLFDTVEQAANLSDEAEDKVRGVHSDASRGGIFWLREMLPQLEHTHVILSGRDTIPSRGEEQSAHAGHFELYDYFLQTWSRSQILKVKGIDLKDLPAYVAELRSIVSSTYESEDVRDFAQHDIHPRVLQTWGSVSEGLPFWISMLFTVHLLGAAIEELDEQQGYFVDHEQAEVRLSATQRDRIRTSLIKQILVNIDASSLADYELLALQLMATVRKGLTPAILARLSERLGHPIDAELVWSRLRQLSVVKERSVPLYTRRRGTADEQEVLLFLHDEMYNWLDSRFGSATKFRDEVSRVLMEWYDEQIIDAESERLAATEALRFIVPGSEDYVLLLQERTVAVERKRQLVLDLLDYAYQFNIDAGTNIYNLQSYAAILSREHDYGVTIRQQGLRNIYRLVGAVPYLIEVECAARWVLRAIHAEEPKEIILGYAERLQPYLAAAEQRQDLHFALLYLALAQLEVYVKGSSQADLDRSLAYLKEAEQHARPSTGEPLTQGHLGQWRTFLLSQIYNWRGYCYRLAYDLGRAIKNYRRAILLQDEIPHVLPEFHGAVLTNRAFAHSEQGELDDAFDFAEKGLKKNQQYASEFAVANTYNALARIALRAADPHQALTYARQAKTIFEQLGSTRGLMRCRPVIAEALRKQAELLAHDAVQQDTCFRTAIEQFEQLVGEMEDQQIPLIERWREVYRSLGCAYRAWAFARSLRPERFQDAQIGADFERAYRYLEQAYDKARESQQSPLILMDILEDLAVVLVNQNIFDARLEHHLSAAEALAPVEYLLIPGQGPSALENAVRGYWRELGQVKIQRMLSAFGTYDFGPGTERAGTAVAQDHEQRLDVLKDAARHMMLALAYLYMYAPRSQALDKASDLILRELRLGRNRDELRTISIEVTRTARSYRLLGGPAHAYAEELMRRVLHDLEPPDSFAW